VLIKERSNRTLEISKIGHKLHFWRINPFFKGSKNHFLSFGEKWCFWPKVHYDLYTRFPGSCSNILFLFVRIPDFGIE
jgi:hypothetical protein